MLDSHNGCCRYFALCMVAAAETPARLLAA